jgi:hypothetical protein
VNFFRGHFGSGPLFYKRRIGHFKAKLPIPLVVLEAEGIRFFRKSAILLNFGINFR